jgi:F-type H+-transporting ATPase subunit epsilon
METSFKLRILTPDGVLFSDTARQVTARNSTGEFGVLPGHTVFASDIVKGKMVIVSKAGENMSFEVGNGLISVQGEEVIVALDSGTKV